MNNEIKKEIDLSVPLWKANIYSFPIVIISLILTGFPFYFIWGIEQVILEFHTTSNLLLLIFVFMIGVILHELIHALSWVAFARIPLSKIKFGFNVMTLSPYAHCGEAVTAKVYRIALLTPAIILGIIPTLISFFTGSVWLLVPGVLFTVTACGDFLIFWLIRKVKNDQLVADDPKKAGCKVVGKFGY
ncbi:MAG: DUF3267 domain-containing protein [Ignavibacteriaceae bacterium]|jgi:hypothetical protein